MQSHNESREKFDVAPERQTARCEPPSQVARNPKPWPARVCLEVEPETTEQPSASSEPCRFDPWAKDECTPCVPHDSPVKAAPEQQNPNSDQCTTSRPLSAEQRMIALADVLSAMARSMAAHLAQLARKEPVP